RRLPTWLFKLLPHLFRGDGEHVMAEFRIPQGLIFRGRVLRQHFLGRSSTRPLPSPPPIAQVEELVPRNREQPTAERAARRIIFQLSCGRHDTAKHFLSQIRRVGVLKLPPTGEGVDHWSVQLHELPPGLVVARIPQANKQTGTSRGHRGHNRLTWQLIRLWQRNLSKKKFDEASLVLAQSIVDLTPCARSSLRRIHATGFLPNPAEPIARPGRPPAR